MFVALVLSVACGVDESWLNEFVPKAKGKAESDLAENRTNLQLAKKGKVVRGSRGTTEKGFVFDNVNEKKQAVARYEYAIKVGEQFLNGTFGSLTDDELLVGVGGLPFYPIGVIQVTSDNGAIVDIGYSPQYGLAFKEDPQRHVWLVHSTDGWIDGSRVDLKQPVVVTGTKRYSTATGTKTIPMVRLLGQGELEEFRKLITAK